MSDDANHRIERARQIIASMTDHERILLRDELDGMIAGPTSTHSGGQWDYQRQPYGSGWIQRERKVRPRKNGSQKVYAYWAFHWIEDGRRKSEHIGSDEKLQQFKQRSSGSRRDE